MRHATLARAACFSRPTAALGRWDPSVLRSEMSKVRDAVRLARPPPLAAGHNHSAMAPFHISAQQVLFAFLSRLDTQGLQSPGGGGGGQKLDATPLLQVTVLYRTHRILPRPPKAVKRGRLQVTTQDSVLGSSLVRSKLAKEITKHACREQERIQAIDSSACLAGQCLARGSGKTAAEGSDGAARRGHTPLTHASEARKASPHAVRQPAP